MIPVPAAPPRGLSSGWHRFFATVVAVQGVHLVEHVIQVFQVYLFGVPEDEALAVLGYLFQIQGTEEWLHLAFNLAYVSALLALVIPLRVLWAHAPVAAWGFWLFIAGTLFESWHSVEHLVIIANVVRNDGCPCPGIVDAALGVTDTPLHFGYNVAAYTATVPAFCLARRQVRSLRAELSARCQEPVRSGP